MHHASMHPSSAYFWMYNITPPPLQGKSEGEGEGGVKRGGGGMEVVVRPCFFLTLILLAALSDNGGARASGGAGEGVGVASGQWFKGSIRTTIPVIDLGAWTSPEGRSDKER